MEPTWRFVSALNIAKARENIKQLLEKRPDDPVYNVKVKPDNPPPYWQIYTQDNHVSFDTVEKLLSSTERKLSPNK